MSIDIPFASALNPYVRVLGKHLDTMAARGAEDATADRDRWRSARFERLAARMYPDAPLSLLTISVEALVWVFDYDDYLADGPTESEQDATRQLAWFTARILAGEVTSRPAPPMGLLWDVCAKARTIGDDAWCFRFRRDVQDFADRMYEEACSRADRQPPAPAAYEQWRRGTSGWALLTDLAELTAGAALAQDVVSSDRYHRVRWAAGDLACAVNDLLSYPKELAAGEYHNLVMVLEHSRQVSVAEARELVSEMIGERLADYQQARGEFLSWHPSAEAYVRALEYLVRGSLDWSLESGRYPELVSAGRP